MIQVTDTRNYANVHINPAYVTVISFLNAALDIAEIYVAGVPFAFRVSYEDAAEVQIAVDAYNEKEGGVNYMQYRVSWVFEGRICDSYYANIEPALELFRWLNTGTVFASFIVRFSDRVKIAQSK